MKNKGNDIKLMLEKSASVVPFQATDEDLALINQHTLKTLTLDDVVVFKITLADNEFDDRNDCPFTAKSIADMANLYPGVTVIKDHSHRTDNQIARVFWAEKVNHPERITKNGEIFCTLEAKIYMLNSAENKAFIDDILAGIKKEVSTSTVPEKLICNICGVDNTKKYCPHYPGYEYHVATGTAEEKVLTCQLIIDGVRDCFELSFVPVGAQRRAKVHKSVAEYSDAEPAVNGSENNKDNLQTAIKLFEEYINIKNLKNKGE